jgi:hypothetical protein
LLIGSYGSDQTAGRGGAVYSYLWKDGSWTYVVALKPPKNQDFLYFGKTIGMSHDYAMIGATGENSGGMYAGAVYNGYWEYSQA